MNRFLGPTHPAWPNQPDRDAAADAAKDNAWTQSTQDQADAGKKPWSIWRVAFSGQMFLTAINAEEAMEIARAELLRLPPYAEAEVDDMQDFFLDQ